MIARTLYSPAAQAQWNADCLATVWTIRTLARLRTDLDLPGATAGLLAAGLTTTAFLLFGDPSAPEPVGVLRAVEP